MTVNVEVVKPWTQAPTIQPLWEWTTTRRTYALTWEHLRVAGFLAVFAGFYFSIVSATDAALQDGVRDTVEDEVRQACAARLVVLEHFPQSAH